MNPRCLEILARLAIAPNGALPRETLMSAFDMRLIASLGTGTRPNMFLDNERGVYQLTQRGYDTLQQNNAILESAIQRETLPNFIRDANTGSVYRARNARRNNATTQASANIRSLIELTIDRNDYVKITCKVSEEFKAWIIAHGTVRNLRESYGSDAVRNWDAENETDFIDCNLQNLDVNSSSSNIVTPTGINSLIIKLACASDDNTYTVKYRGLVAWELLQTFSNKIGDNVVSFYKNYVKPCNLKIVVNWSV